MLPLFLHLLVVEADVEVVLQDRRQEHLEGLLTPAHCFLARTTDESQVVSLVDLGHPEEMFFRPVEMVAQSVHHTMYPKEALVFLPAMSQAG